MKRILALLLLTLFSLHFTGSFLGFKMQQYLIRREIKQHIRSGVPDAELKCITLQNAEFLKLEHEGTNEFRYKDYWYDVVFTRKLDANTTIYYCIKDSEETELYAELYKRMQDSKRSKKQRTAPLKIGVKYLNQKQVDAYSILELTNFNNNALPITYENQYQSPFIDINSPPPQNLS